MPIYEYRCQQCGHELEKLQRMSDAPLLDCPACEQPALKKLISAAAFRLKGSGWYETDFKKDGKRNLAGDQQPDSSSNASDSGKSDAKAAGSDKSAEKAADQSKSGSKSTTNNAASAASA